MAERFRGRVVVVTGASSGVGRAVARAFGAAGARVALLARGRDGLEAAAAEVRAAGGDARVLPLDVADARAVDAAAEVSAAWGGIDVWVNDAMVSVLAPVAEIRPEEYRRVMEVNYLGAVHGTIAALRHMRPRGAGTIVQIGSALAYRSIPLQAAYCASKAALRGFTDSLRSELHHERSRIRVTMVHLPAVNTPQFEVIRNRLPRHGRPVAPVFQPEVVARAVLYAAAHAPRELWVGWPTIQALLGQRFVPGLLDRWLARKAWDGQMTDLAPKPRTDAVDAPLPGDRGAHGIFDAEARRRSAALFLRTHRGAVAVAALVAVGAAAAARGR
jgi:NAD(P)-dependent dehydrogenase (short-subunit alcohol dehydrogenase family)